MKKFEHIVKVCILIFSMLSINLPAWGNSVSSKNSSDDIKDGKIVMEGNHATFTLEGNTIKMSTLNGYELGTVKAGKSSSFSFKWTENADCKISVTNISFKIKAYTSNAIANKNGKIVFNGNTIQVASQNFTGGGFSTISTGNGTYSSGMKLECKNTASLYSFDYYIKEISITYTITPKYAPTIKQSTETINVSLTNENKLDMTNLIGVSDVTDFMPVAFGSNSFSDPEGISSTGAYTFTEKYFYATKAGVYTFKNPYIAAKTNCHEKSNTTKGTVTITVNRLNQTLTMANGKVNATTDKSNPTRLDLSTLCTQVGNGTVTYELVSAPIALDGTSAADSYVIDGKYFHAWVAGTYTLRASAPKTAQYNAATPQEFSVTVNRVNNTLSFYKTVDTRYVEQTVNNAVTTNSNATIHATTTDGTLAYYDGTRNKIFIPNSNNQSFNSTTVIITISQDATDVYAASGEKTLTLIINKYDNAINATYKWRGEDHTVWTERLSFEAGAYVEFKSNNTEEGAPLIEVTPKTGTEFATFWPVSESHDENGDSFWSSWKIGEATWEVSQAENYKYKAAPVKTFKINVNVNSDPTQCSCNLYEESRAWGKERKASTIDSIGFGAIGDSLYFDMIRNGLAGNTAKYSLYTEGAWTGTTNVSARASDDEYTHFGPIDLTTNGNTTAVRFAPSHNLEWWIGDTDDPYINNIRVTRKRWMKILDGAGKTAKEIPSLPQMKRYIDDDTVKVTFYVDFSTCDKLVKVASSFDHVTFRNKLTKDTASYNTAPVTTRGYSDKVAVTVYYYSDEVEETTVTITIYTEFEIKTITIPVKTEGYVFIGTKDDQWTEAKNWNVGRVPNANHDVIIEAKAVVSSEQSVRSMDITTGSVTIAPTGGLTVGKGGISGATKDNLILKAGTEGKIKGETGYLRISPEYVGTMPEATVELFSIGYLDMTVSNFNDLSSWQYVGYPIGDDAAVKDVFKQSLLYNWNDTTNSWENNRKTCTLKPFEGYCTTQYKNPNGLLISFAGQLVDVGEETVNLTYNGGESTSHNMLANSYTAPIDITKFEDTDFVNAERCIYFFNTGSRNDIAALEEDVKKGEAYNAPGQYFAVPIGNADQMKSAFSEAMPTSIAPMQGFCVHATGENATVTFDYSKLVWTGDYNKNGNTPLRSPARTVLDDEPLSSLCVTLYTDGMLDNLYLLESENNVPTYENGQDARKMMGGGLNIFSIIDADTLAVDATNNFIGTRVGVRTGDTIAYVMTFSHLRSDKELLLLDNETEQTIAISEGTEYPFFAQPNSVITDRFMILGHAKTPEVTTAIEEAADNDGAKVRKFIKDNQLYILKNGVLYNATGARVY